LTDLTTAKKKKGTNVGLMMKQQSCVLSSYFSLFFNSAASNGMVPAAIIEVID